MNLVEFLSARLDEDAAIAKAAIADDGGEDGGFEDAFHELIRPPSGVGLAQGGFGEAAARLIVHSTPRRLLAEVDAKRRIVDLLTYQSGGVRAAFGPEQQAVLRIMAEVYVDHPDYREEWRP